MIDFFWNFFSKSFLDYVSCLGVSFLEQNGKCFATKEKRKKKSLFGTKGKRNLSR
jgi:hypothetical protein